MLTYKAERQAYHDAKGRCENPNHSRYHDWGGRGIEFWFNSFNHFINTIGPRPPGTSLDRIDNEAHYCPGNVRWATRSKQQHNRRVSKRNKTKITGVRQVKAPGLITPTYQAHINLNGKFIQLYAGPDFFEACCARKSKEACLNTELLSTQS